MMIALLLADVPTLPAPDGWIQYGALGIVAFIVFAAAALTTAALLMFGPKLLAAATSIATALTALVVEVKNLAAKMDKVHEAVEDLREEIRRSPARN
jgi:cell division protein FtsB